MNAQPLSDDEKMDKTMELLGKQSSTKEDKMVERSETHWAQVGGDGTQERAPKQFSEIDQSASSQAAASATMETVGKLAFQDAVTGVDTDRGPVMDAVYNDAVTEGHRTTDGPVSVNKSAAD